MESTVSTQSLRIPSVDIARFYAMVLVYYGHIVEQVMYLGSSEAAMQYKFIYSFHMPLFFVIAGTVAVEEKRNWPVVRFLKTTFASRLAPYVFFSVLLAVLSLFVNGWFPLVSLKDAGAYVEATMATLSGFPAFCVPLWFMALLVSVEIFHYFVCQHITSIRKLAVLAAGLYVGGYYINEAYFFVGKELIFWFVNEVPVIYCFYLFGVYIRKRGWLEKNITPMSAAGGALVCLMLVVATFNLNQGPFRIIEAVVIVLSGHGHIFYFILTAFAGSIMVLLAARSTPVTDWMSYMGRNSLSLFCLNGVFYHFVNPFTAKWFAAHFSLTNLSVLLYSGIMTALSLLLCLPAIVVLTGFVPQFMGKPTKNGPIFSPLMRE